VREISFEGPDVLQIGKFRAIDLFGDGSFYLLDTPGHAVGHLGGLARTTKDTFMFFGGDLCHHGGEIRPSEHLPLPEKVHLQAFAHFKGGFCPGAELEALQKGRSRAVNEPFFDPNMGLNIPQAIETIKKTQEADADDNVLFIYAHDNSLRGNVDLFPLNANDWKQKGWRSKLLWHFLEDFEAALRQQGDKI
jgi:glyoxylase-like metal-dependent hydrolase (beta-lactamase superfamily II)